MSSCGRASALRYISCAGRYAYVLLRDLVNVPAACLVVSVLTSMSGFISGIATTFLSATTLGVLVQITSFVCLVL